MPVCMAVTSQYGFTACACMHWLHINACTNCMSGSKCHLDATTHAGNRGACGTHSEAASGDSPCQPGRLRCCGQSGERLAPVSLVRWIEYLPVACTLVVCAASLWSWLCARLTSKSGCLLKDQNSQVTAQTALESKMKQHPLQRVLQGSIPLLGICVAGLQ